MVYSWLQFINSRETTRNGDKWRLWLFDVLWLIVVVGLTGFHWHIPKTVQMWIIGDLNWFHLSLA